MRIIPDRWTIVTLNGEITKVLSGWYGNYLEGDEWRLSSSIVEIKDCGSYWAVLTASGSQYELIKKQEGTSSLMMSVMSEWVHKRGIRVKIEFLEELV